jgi:hypothetical protein
MASDCVTHKKVGDMHAGRSPSVVPLGNPSRLPVSPVFRDAAKHIVNTEPDTTMKICLMGVARG